MSNLYFLLIVIVLISSIPLLISILHTGSTHIESITRSVENGRSVYDIEVTSNNNNHQSYDIILGVNDGKIAKINDTL